MARPRHCTLDRGPVAGFPVEAQIARRLVPYLRLARIESVSSVDDGGQRFVIDGDQLGGVPRRGRGFRDDHRDRVANMPHPPARDRGMRRQHRLRAVAVADDTDARDTSDPVSREIFPGEDGCHAGGGERRGRVDRADTAMGMRRTQHEGVRLTGPADVVDVSAVTGDKSAILDAANRLTDAELLHGT